MASPFTLPPAGFGPGSQNPFDGDGVQYTPMPQGMRTYSAHLPEVAEGADVGVALALLTRIAEACDRAQDGRTSNFDLSVLDTANRAFLADTLGEGEVSARIAGVPAIAAQETVFAGVWSLAGAGVDRIEVAPVPSVARARAHIPSRIPEGTAAHWAAGVLHAPALLSELQNRSATFSPADEPLVINLSLLPHTPEDLVWLDAALGQGSTTILSRGYGNCRITAAAMPNVWRVQFFNSMDTLILDTFEVTDIPVAALAASEDFADSAARIRDVLEMLS